LSFTIRLTKHRDGVLNPRKFPLQIVKWMPYRSMTTTGCWRSNTTASGCSRAGTVVSRAYIRENGYDISRRHQHITAALAALPAGRFVMDGELVVLDEDGRSNFAKLAHGHTGTHYYAFDLLMLGDVDLRAKPLHVRKAALADLLDGAAKTGVATATTSSEGAKLSSRLCARPASRASSQAPRLDVCGRAE
jgi:hypothetical protein